MPSRGSHARRIGSFSSVALPVVLWIAFVNAVGHHGSRDQGTDAALHGAVEADLASRRCPGLRLDPAGFRAFARGRGVGHADLYQKRSPRLQKAADHLERRLRADHDGECQRLLDVYGGSGPAPRLLMRT